MNRSSNYHACPDSEAPAATQTLLKGISTRADITPANWTLYLSERLRQMWRSGGEPGQPPFAPARRQESVEYAALPTPDRLAPHTAVAQHRSTSQGMHLYCPEVFVCPRVMALKALCEARLERDDIRGQIEDALKPLKAHKQAAKAPNAPPSLEEFRK